MEIKFGPAGNSLSFTSAGFSSSEDAPAWLAGMGLNAYEYQCGRGVNIKEDKALRIGNAAKENGITMSIHSPYFINLSSGEEERVEKNINYIIQCCEVAKSMDAERIVVHLGGVSKMTREEAMANTKNTLKKALSAMDSRGFQDKRICVETMGKINVLGTLEETLEVCTIDERLIPCIDFGHLNARTHGGLREEEDFKAIFDAVENVLGRDRAASIHSHFSKIEYSAGGEVRHLTLDDKTFGPEFEYAAEIIAKRGYTPTIICESAGTQAEDAVKLFEIYKKAAEK